MNSFQEVRARALACGLKTLAVAAAADEPVMEAVWDAVKAGMAKAILVGDEEKIITISRKIGMNIDGDVIRVIHEPDAKAAAAIAVKLVHDADADILMKGMIGSSDFLRAVLNKEYGLRTGNPLTSVGVVELQELKRLVFMADGGMQMYPDLEAKKGILRCIGQCCRALEVTNPKVAAICAVEVVNPAMQCTLDAAELQRLGRAEGAFSDMIVEGPLSLDIALSEETAIHKGMVNSVVAGKADALLMPNIECGNVFWKTLTHFNPTARFGGIIAGPAKPVILTSRGDSADTKLNSIAMAILMS